MFTHPSVNCFDEWGKNATVERLVAQRPSNQADNRLHTFDRSAHCFGITDITLDNLQPFVGDLQLAR
jgi:hypothetical protein